MDVRAFLSSPDRDSYEVFGHKDDELPYEEPENETMRGILQASGIIMLIIIGFLVIWFINKLILKIFVWVITLLLIAMVVTVLLFIYAWRNLRGD